MLFVSLSYGQDQASAAPPANDAIVHHMEELEAQVKELRAEVAALKGSDKAAPAATVASVPAAAQSNVVTARPHRVRRCRTIPRRIIRADYAERLRGRLLRANFNNPASQTNGFRFFDGATTRSA